MFSAPSACHMLRRSACHQSHQRPCGRYFASRRPTTHLCFLFFEQLNSWTETGMRKPVSSGAPWRQEFGHLCVWWNQACSLPVGVEIPILPRVYIFPSPPSLQLQVVRTPSCELLSASPFSSKVLCPRQRYRSTASRSTAFNRISRPLQNQPARFLRKGSSSA